MIKRTEHGWQSESRRGYPDNARVRRTFARREDAEAQEQENQKWRHHDKSIDKIKKGKRTGKRTRCAQERKDGNRCRRVARDIHNQNGKPTCHQHQKR